MALTRPQINRRLKTIGLDNIQHDSIAKLLFDIQDAAEAQITALETSVTNLNTWAGAIATKLNADAGVTDVNYDTNPQA